MRKKWSRGDEIKIKIKPKNLYSRYTKYKKKVTPSPNFFFSIVAFIVNISSFLIFITSFSEFLLILRWLYIYNNSTNEFEKHVRRSPKWLLYWALIIIQNVGNDLFKGACRWLFIRRSQTQSVTSILIGVFALYACFYFHISSTKLLGVRPRKTSNSAVQQRPL